MVTFESKIKTESRAFPGVSFTVRRLNQIQRAKRDLEIAANSARMDDLTRQWRTKTTGMLPSQTIEDPELLRLAQDISLEHAATLLPISVRHGLIAVEGLEIDGVAATVEMLLSSGPEDLLREIDEACRAASGLSEDQQKNLQSPGDSPRQTDGPTSITTAVTAAA